MKYILIFLIVIMACSAYAGTGYKLAKDENEKPLTGIEITCDSVTAKNGSDSYYPVPVRTLRALNVHDSGTVTTSLAGQTALIAVSDTTGTKTVSVSNQDTRVLVYPGGTIVTYDTQANLVGSDTGGQDTAVYWAGQVSDVTSIWFQPTASNQQVNIYDTSGVTTTWGGVTTNTLEGGNRKIHIQRSVYNGIQLNFNPPLRFNLGVSVGGGGGGANGFYILIQRKQP